MNARQLYLQAATATLLALHTAGCAGTKSVMIPIDYKPRNAVKAQGVVTIGRFVYRPFEEGKVAPNQIQTSAKEQIFLAMDFADLIRRATAAELERSGLKFDDKARLQVRGNVIEFRADLVGRETHWASAIQYTIVNQDDGQMIFNKVYRTDTKTPGRSGLLSDNSEVVTELIAKNYEKFVSDTDVRIVLTKYLPKPDPCEELRRMNIFCTSVSLFRAIDSGDARLTSMLLAGGVDVNLAEPTGQTPLLAATRGNRLKVAELLVQQGADVNAQFPFKTPPIHLFMRGKNAIELTGYTPLMCAAENSNVMMIKLLLDKGADPKLKNKAGETALDIAHKLGDEQTVRVLEDANRRTLNE